jgi:Uma2 family endonuclease
MRSAGLVVRQEQPLTTDSSEPEPDLSVVRGSADDYREQHPRTAELVIEVAVNTEEIDLGKAALYAEAAVTEYWLVEPRTRRITVFRSPGDRSYAQSTVYEGAQTVTCAALPTFEVGGSHRPDRHVPRPRRRKNGRTPFSIPPL